MEEDKTPIKEIPELSPCKKCGSTKVDSFKEILGFKNNVACFDCHATTADYSSEYEAVVAWNNGATLNRAQRRKHKKRENK